DVRSYAAAGLDGIGIWELKLPDGGDAEALELFEASGLEPASAVPAVPSILPLPLLGGPEDPAERVEAICASVERLAPFRPAGIVCLTGTGAGRAADGRRRGRPPRPRGRARAVPARRRRALDDRGLDPRGGRADPRRRRPGRP